MPFLLDTNVVSELQRKARCHPEVRAWYDRTPVEELFVSVITLGEMRRGVEKKRKHDPEQARVFEKWLHDVELIHGDRVLPIGPEIADIWGGLGASEQINPVDALIAATAIHLRLTVATRNERHFQRVGVDFFNPFRSGLS